MRKEGGGRGEGKGGGGGGGTVKDKDFRDESHCRYEIKSFVLT